MPACSSAYSALAVSPRRPTPKTSSEGGESVIAANLTIEGKIEGSGNVRMAGRFKGDVRIDGNFSIEPGAHLTGQVLAGIVVDLLFSALGLVPHGARPPMPMQETTFQWNYTTWLDLVALGLRGLLAVLHWAGGDRPGRFYCCLYRVVVPAHDPLGQPIRARERRGRGSRPVPARCAGRNSGRDKAA